MGKSKITKNIILYSTSLLAIIISFAGYIFMFTEKINPKDEFLLYKCKSISHKNEKVYMKINNLEKNENNSSYHILSFDLRYEGNKPIQVLSGENNFSNLSKFKLTVISNILLKKLDYNYFDLSDTSEYDYRVHSYRENLPDILNPGDSLKDIKIGLNFFNNPNVDVSDLKFRIKNIPSGSHRTTKLKYIKVKEFKGDF